MLLSQNSHFVKEVEKKEAAFKKEIEDLKGMNQRKNNKIIKTRKAEQNQRKTHTHTHTQAAKKHKMLRKTPEYWNEQTASK